MHLNLQHTALLTRVLFLTQLSATLALLGLIWFVQLVHYPLFRRVGQPAFLAYEQEHANRTGWIAVPLMIAELLSAAAMLLSSLRPAGIPSGQAWTGAALVAVLWLSTGLLQVPLHNRLHRTADPALMRRLVHSNWLRTAAWSLRAALLLFWLNRLLPPA